MAWRHGARLIFVQRAVARALDFGRRQRGAGGQGPRHRRGEIRRNRAGPRRHEALRKQALDLLAAPTIDRAAVERLRVDAVAMFDAKSKAVVAGMLDIADQLTPAQRAQLAANSPPCAHMADDGPLGRPRRSSVRRARTGPDSGPDKE